MILLGSKLAEKINTDTKKILGSLKTKPGLAVVLVGNNTASQLYVSIKKRVAERIGINFFKYHFSNSVSEKELSKIISKLNNNKNINGIIIQLPLPEKFNTNKIIQFISPEKDVDCLQEKNGKTAQKISSPLISGVLELLKKTGQNIDNQNISIVVKNKTFYKSVKKSLKKIGATSEKINWLTEIENTSTNSLLIADIIIIALGKPRVLTAEMVKKGVVIIDIGINKVNGKTVGDADFDNLIKKVRFITPVPNGVGPMTVAMLMSNVVKLYILQKTTPMKSQK